MFEKVLKSGTKNNVVKKDLNAESSKDLSIDEVKELMQEQKQRLATNAPDEEDEDLDEYDYNNDTLGIGDDYIDNIDSPAPLTCQVEEESTHGNESLLEPETQKQSKITDSLDLESNDYQQEQHREKSVTNNLQSQEIESKEYTIQDFKPSVAKKTQVQIATARTELDEALEDASSAPSKALREALAIAFEPHSLEPAADGEVVLKNPGNSAVEFFFTAAPPFSVRPDQGVVPPFGEAKVIVTWTPREKTKNAGTLAVHVDLELIRDAHLAGARATPVPDRRPRASPAAPLSRSSDTNANCVSAPTAASASASILPSAQTTMVYVLHRSV